VQVDDPIAEPLFAGHELQLADARPGEKVPDGQGEQEIIELEPTFVDV